MKKHRKIIVLLAFVIVSVLSFLPIPKQIECTMMVSTSTGATAKVDIDILYFSALVLPSYVKGTLSVNGIEYTDQYTKLKEFTSVVDNRLFPFDWWATKEVVPYNMTFLRSDCIDVNAALLNRINILDIVLNKENCKIHYMYTDESNQVDTRIEGISFWGPAQNAEEAKLIAEYFGYQLP